MEYLPYIGLALVAYCFIKWVANYRKRDSRFEAEKVLKSRGMEVFTYLPTFGAGDVELRNALTVFEFTGEVVLDREGKLVGRVLPKAVAKTPRTEPGLRLVVDNTK